MIYGSTQDALSRRCALSGGCVAMLIASMLVAKSSLKLHTISRRRLLSSTDVNETGVAPGQQLYLIRHAQSTIQGNFKVSCCGLKIPKKKISNHMKVFKKTNDPHLTEIGVEQAKQTPEVITELLEKQKNKKTINIYSSPCIRAVETVWGITYEFRKNNPNTKINVRFLWGFKSATAKFGQLKYEMDGSSAAMDVAKLKQYHEAEIAKFTEKYNDSDDANPLEFDYEYVHDDFKGGATDMIRHFGRTKSLDRQICLGGEQRVQTRQSHMEHEFKRLKVQMANGENPIVVCHGSAIKLATKVYNLKMSEHKKIMNVEAFKLDFTEPENVTMTRHGGILEGERKERKACFYCNGSGVVGGKCPECKGSGKGDKFKETVRILDFSSNESIISNSGFSQNIPEHMLRLDEANLPNDVVNLRRRLASSERSFH